MTSPAPLTWFDVLFMLTPAEYVESIEREVPVVKNRFNDFICKLGDNELTFYRPGYEKRI